jgi:DNA mismatch repair protein MutS2
MIVDSELDLHGHTIDEALPKLNNYIYKSYMGNMAAVRINHGHGTGILRQAVQRELKGNSLVKSFRPGGYGEGGEGVTIVELTDR